MVLSFWEGFFLAGTDDRTPKPLLRLISEAPEMPFCTFAHRDSVPEISLKNSLKTALSPQTRA
jgi:hypothetical protein